MWDEFEDHPMRKDYRRTGRLRIRTDAARRGAGESEGALRVATADATALKISLNGAAGMSCDRSKTLEAMSGHRRDELRGLEGDLLEVSMGPQHPSTHGVFRMDVALDGEIVRKLKPVFGYLHRNHEKIGENDELSRLDAVHRPARLFLLDDEQLGLCAQRGKTRRHRSSRTRRISSRHSRRTDAAAKSRVAARISAQDMGAWGTPLMYAFREREKILDLFESLTGSRMMCNYMRFGGCRVDCQPDWLEQAKKVVDAFPRFLDEFETLLVENEILMARTQGVGIFRRSSRLTPASPARCCARAASITTFAKWTTTAFYPRFKFRVPLGEHGDVYDRLHDARAGNARDRRNLEAGVARQFRPARSWIPKAKIRAVSSESRRSLRAHRRPEGRARLLSDQRRLARIRIGIGCARRVSST